MRKPGSANAALRSAQAAATHLLVALQQRHLLAQLLNGAAGGRQLALHIQPLHKWRQHELALLGMA